MQRRGVFAGVAVVVVLGLTGCSSNNSGDDDDNPGNGGDDGEVTSIHITFDGDDVNPNGEQIEVPVSEPIELHISADEPGELHVHTSPEQEIPYDAGESTHELTLDRAGVYEVESHDLEKIVVELEAS